MTIGEFKEFLSRCDIPDDWQLSIVVRGGFCGIGRPIKQASRGFDWDYGKVLLHPEQGLQQARTRKKGDRNGQSQVSAQ